MKRFFDKINVQPNDCWLWTSDKMYKGYGRFSYQGKAWFAHRWALKFIGGQELNPALVIDHVCGVRHCVNPDHLEQVTNKENTARSSLTPATINRLKTACLRGHTFNKENTILTKAGRGCRTCQKVAMRKHYMKRRSIEAF